MQIKAYAVYIIRWLDHYCTSTLFISKYRQQLLYVNLANQLYKYPPCKAFFGALKFAHNHILGAMAKADGTGIGQTLFFRYVIKAYEKKSLSNVIVKAHTVLMIWLLILLLFFKF